MRRTLMAGGVLAVAAVLVVIVSSALDLELESVALLGGALGAVVALVPDRTPLVRLGGFAAGFVAAWVGYAVRAALLPDTAGGRAVAVGLVVLLCVGITAATMNRLPLWTTLLGTAALSGAYEFTYAAAPPELALHLGQHRDHPAVQRRRRLPRRRAGRSDLASRGGDRSPGRRAVGRQHHDHLAHHEDLGRLGRLEARRLHDGEDQVNARLNAPLRAAAVAAVTAVIASVAMTPAYAADGDVKVVNTETVQVYTSPSGQVQTRRVYEQLAMTGTGSVDLKNPISTDHLRNLDGFGGFDVKDGEQLTKTTVDGEKKLRSVSDFNGKLPLDVSVAYKLDGKNVKPGDVIGKDGKLEVVYTVENVTGTPQDVSFPDGKGGTVTKTVDVPIPMVGSLSLVAPAYVHQRVVAAGEHRRRRQGRHQAVLHHDAVPADRLDDRGLRLHRRRQGRRGPACRDLGAPGEPAGEPHLQDRGDQLQGRCRHRRRAHRRRHADRRNLLKLRDGAGDLLAGLIKLRDGAGQLNAGLAGEAVPGSEKLAKGAGDLDNGLGQLNSGAKKLAAGNSELSGGADQLSAGTKKLKAGANKLSAGAGTLADGTGKAASGSKQLYAGTQDLSAGATKVSAGATTIDGFMKQIATGQGDLLSGIKLLESGVQALPASVRTQLSTDPQYQALLGGMQSVVTGIGAHVGSPGTGRRRRCSTASTRSARACATLPATKQRLLGEADGGTPPSAARWTRCSTSASSCTGAMTAPASCRRPSGEPRTHGEVTGCPCATNLPAARRFDDRHGGTLLGLVGTDCIPTGASRSEWTRSARWIKSTRSTNTGAEPRLPAVGRDDQPRGQR